MNDITICVNDACDLRASCLRGSEPDGRWVSQAFFAPNPETGLCWGFVPNRRALQRIRNLEEVPSE